jgi:Predicted integral membrane protein (DUF2269)
VSLFPILLAIHIVLAISLFLPSVLLPFTLRARRAGPPGPVGQGLLWLQSNGTVVIGAGIFATGLGLVAYLGAQLLAQPWLLAALALYAANLGLAFFIQRPGLRRLVGLPQPRDDAERERWRANARRQRYVSYLMAGVVGLIGFLMSNKPPLW